MNSLGGKLTARRYGEMMLPLDVAPLDLPAEMRTDPLVLRLIALLDATSRAEKISDPDDWTTDERAAYARGDTAEFSRLRGYTAHEIQQFLEMVETVHQVDKKIWRGQCNYGFLLDRLPDQALLLLINTTATN
jgi:hypothetical protein